VVNLGIGNLAPIVSCSHDLGCAADRRPKAPIFTGRLVVEGGVATCLLSDREVRIEAPAKLLAALARACDGVASLDQILSKLAEGWSPRDLNRLVDALFQHGVLCEARDLAMSWWQYIKNPRLLGGSVDAEVISGLPEEASRRTRTAAPGALYHDVVESPFSALLKRRSSTRTFSGQKVSSDKFLQLLWAAYGAGDHRTVPSAGGIYPLQVHFVNLRPAGDLAPGVYRVSYLQDGRIGMELVGDDARSVFRAFLEPDGLTFAQGIVVISGELGRTALKYETRAALYVPLEAGHAAQNVLLSATEAELAAVEIGGFVEDRLATILKLGSGMVPLTTIIVGTLPATDQCARAERTSEIEYRWVDAGAGSYVPPCFVGSARVKNQETSWAWGRSPDPELAHTKAIAEAQERWSCTVPSGLQEGRFGDVPNPIAPQEIVAYGAAQYARPEFPYLPFDPGANYAWKKGEDVLTGKRWLVLADFVYFGDFLSRPRPYTSASSSGAAAYTSQQGALERAVLELIERDAFMVTWLGRTVRPTIEPSSLPATVAARIRALRSAGVEIVVKDHSLGLAPVVFVFAQSVQAGFTMASAGAAFDPEAALDSALMEVEFAVATRLASKKRRAIEPEEVESPEDHMDLYAQRQYFRRADILARQGEKILLSDVGHGYPNRWDELANLLAGRGHKILWFDLTPPGASLHQGRTPLHVGRAIVPGMISISFGQGQEPLASFGLRPHASARRPRRDRRELAACLFPHPFG